MLDFRLRAFALALWVIALQGWSHARADSTLHLRGRVLATEDEAESCSFLLSFESGDHLQLTPSDEQLCDFLKGSVGHMAALTFTPE